MHIWIIKEKWKKKKSPNCCFDLYAITLNISITMVFKTLIDCTLSSVSSKDDITKIFNSDRSACFLFSLVRPDHTAFSYVTKFGTIYLYQESISSNSKYIIKLQQPEMWHLEQNTFTENEILSENSIAIAYIKLTVSRQFISSLI
jgi:hypothetical protein